MNIAAILLAAVAYAGSMPPVTGATNPAVTQANIHQTICVSGWTATVRPPASYTTRLKLQQMAVQHIAGLPSAVEEDHLISLEIGGHPTDPKNLWPQHWSPPWGAHDKDRLENALHRDVCAGRETLAQAQHEIATNWIAAYQKRFGQ